MQAGASKRQETKGLSGQSETGWTRDLLDSPHDTPDKARRVRSMFNAIAPRYELVNRLFSGGRDAYWRRRAVQLSRAGSGDDVLDIASGTGDFARSFLKANVRSVTGCDFAHEMLVRARAAAGDRARGWCECDALCLPFSSGSFSVTSCAFGVRNFQRLKVGLAEMFRVLRPGGRCVILEFSEPGNAIFRGLYSLYANRLMPIAATLVSGDKSGAYRYLPRSVVSFATVGTVCELLKDAGFARVSTTPLTLGVVTVYVATRE